MAARAFRLWGAGVVVNCSHVGFATCTSERSNILRAPHSGQGTEKASGKCETSPIIGISVWQFLQVTALGNAAGSEISVLRLNRFKAALRNSVLS